MSQEQDNLDVIAHQISNHLMVGLRKGVDSDEASRLYRAVNPLFFNSDVEVRGIATEFTRALGQNAAQAFIEGGNAEHIAAKLKEAAIVDRTACSGAKFSVTPDNQGFECLKSLFPVEYKENDYTYRIIAGPDDRFSFRVHRLTDGETDCTDENFWRRIDVGEITGLVLLKLIDEHDELKHRFAEQLVSPEPKMRKEIFEAANNMQDSDWKALAFWLILELRTSARQVNK